MCAAGDHFPSRCLPDAFPFPFRFLPDDAAARRRGWPSDADTRAAGVQSETWCAPQRPSRRRPACSFAAATEPDFRLAPPSRCVVLPVIPPPGPE